MFDTVKVTPYTAFGLNIISEFLLPELKIISHEMSKPDLIIHKEDLSLLWSEYANSDSYYYIKESFCMFKVPDVAIYKVENGRYISFSPIGGSNDDQIRLYLLGTCLGVALMQRKILPIHGSSVLIDGKAYAIVGDSGAGKSTLATAFIKRGYPILTDDVIAVTLNKDKIPLVTPSYPQQKLWKESLDKFGMNSNQFKPIYDRETKFAIPVTDHFIDKPMPLAGIFMLNITEQNEIEIVPIEQLERFPILYYNTYRNFMIKPLGLLEWHFEMSANMVNKLDLYRIMRPRSRFTADELVDNILNLIRAHE